MADLLILDLAAIPGESILEGHKDKIELMSFSHNVAQLIIAAPSNTKRTSGRPTHGNLMVTKKFDLASCKLVDYCNQAKLIPTLKLTVAQENAGVIQVYLTYDCTDVLVTSVNHSGGGGVPMETIAFDYAKITWTYTKQGTAVSPAGNDSCIWDLTTNMPK
jgi:type VI secretion system secreted protein Hcp